MACCIKQYGIWQVSRFMIIGQLSNKNLERCWTAIIDEVIILVLGRCASFLLKMEKG
jgi:hypothetical protein